MVLSYFNSEHLKLEQNFGKNVFSAMTPWHSFPNDWFGNVVPVLSVWLMKLDLCAFVYWYW